MTHEDNRLKPGDYIISLSRIVNYSELTPYEWEFKSEIALLKKIGFCPINNSLSKPKQVYELHGIIYNGPLDSEISVDSDEYEGLLSRTMVRYADSMAYTYKRRFLKEIRDENIGDDSESKHVEYVKISAKDAKLLIQMMKRFVL